MIFDNAEKVQQILCLMSVIFSNMGEVSISYI